MDDKVLVLLQQLIDGQNRIESRLNTIENDISEIKIDLKHLQTQTNTLEKRVIDLDRTIRFVNAEVGDVKLDLNLLKQNQ